MTDGTAPPVALAVKLPFATPEEFLARYGANVSRGGIYLRSRLVKAPGTRVTLDLRLSGGERLLYASARVEFVTRQAGAAAGGMGLRFLVVDPATRQFLETSVGALPHGASFEVPIPAGAEPDYGLAGKPSVGGPPRVANPSPPRGAVQVTAPRVGATPGTIPAPPFEAPKEEPKRQGPIIGIDLGTTNSCAAVVRNGKPTVLVSREGHNTVPSIIALNARGRIVVGHPARSQTLTNPRLTVYGAKRLIGRQYESPVVQSAKERFAYEITAGENGEAAVKLGDRVYSLQQISAMILREVREVAQNQLGQEVSRAVITVPAYYNDNQRLAVREAGRLAGLYVERILNEPTAAALAYGYGRDLQKRVLVYDLGGGTFDASILELSGSVYEVVSTGGDTFLGGIDFDHAIVGWLVSELEKKTRRPFQGDRVAMQRILDAAERAKCALSLATEIRVHVPFVTAVDGSPFDLDVVLTRDRLVELTSSLVDRTLAKCQEVLDARKLQPSDIDDVILTGGQSRAPLVHQKVEAFFGKPPARNVHPDEAVALGAGLLAHSLGQLEGVVLIDVLPMAIGVGLPGGRFKPVLEQNAKLPAKKTYTILTTRDDQPQLEVAIFQGDAPKAQENEYLGTLTLSGLPKGPRGTVSTTVTFEISEEATLKVSAREDRTGREVSSMFSTRESAEALRARLAEGAGDGPPAEAPPTEVAPEPAPSEPPPASPPERKGFLRRLFGR